MNAGASTLNVAALAALERAINAALGMDAATREQVGAHGRHAAVDAEHAAGERAYVAPAAVSAATSETGMPWMRSITNTLRRVWSQCTSGT